MTPFDFILLALACIGAHRLWNYEAVFSWARTIFANFPPLGCRVCNPIWLSLPIVSAWLWLPRAWVLVPVTVLAIYPIIRGLVWVNDMAGIIQHTRSLEMWEAQRRQPPQG